MLTSDYGNYSATDSLNSESSEYLSSEIDPQNGNESNTGNGAIISKKRSKTRPRSQKKVKYWTLPTMSSGTFNPSMLTARQQLQYLAQKSKLGEESESLELSPLRLDRIKFEEMRSLNAGGANKEQHESSPSPSSSSSHTKESISPKSNSHSRIQSPLSPSPRYSSSKHQQSSSSQPARGSKLKDEIVSSPTTAKDRKLKQLKKAAIKSVSESETGVESVVATAATVGTSIIPGTTATTATDNTTTSTAAAANVNTSIIPDITASITNELTCPSPSTGIAQLSMRPPSTRTSFFGTVKGLLFDYNETRRIHFENFLKDFANRLGLSPDDEIVVKKRDEIINKGMI